MTAPGSSLVQRLPAGPKLALLAASAVGLLALTDLLGLALVLAVVAGLFPLAGLPVGTAPQALRPAAPLLVLVLGAHGLLGDWVGGALIVGRLLVLLLLASLVTATTRVSDMVEVIERLCRPLRPLGVRPARVALVLAMTIRFVPLLAHKAEQIREAQRARGAERSVTASVVPLLIAALRMADDLGDALEARGFEG